MTEMHLRQRGFTYSGCRSFTKNKERMNKFKETRWFNIYLSKRRDYGLWRF